MTYVESSTRKKIYMRPEKRQAYLGRESLERIFISSEFPLGPIIVRSNLVSHCSSSKLNDLARFLSFQVH